MCAKSFLRNTGVRPATAALLTALTQNTALLHVQLLSRLFVITDVTLCSRLNSFPCSDHWITALTVCDPPFPRQQTAQCSHTHRSAELCAGFVCMCAPRNKQPHKSSFLGNWKLKEHYLWFKTKVYIESKRELNVWEL